MFYDAERKEYYCLRCPFTGTEAEVLLNEMAKFRYKSMMTLIIIFD